MSNLTTQLNLKADNNGTPGAIINNSLNRGDNFFVEILFQNNDSNPIGITSSAINLSFDPNQLKNIDNLFDPGNINSALVTANFPLGRTGILDNSIGAIANLGGGSLPIFGIGSPIGANQFDTFSLLHFQAIGNQSSVITLNIDLSQTGFADGTFADAQSQSQFSQIVAITGAQAIPESTPILGLLVIGAYLLIQSLYTKASR